MCQGETCQAKLVHCTHEQVQLPRNLVMHVCGALKCADGFSFVSGGNFQGKGGSGVNGVFGRILHDYRRQPGLQRSNELSPF